MKICRSGLHEFQGKQCNECMKANKKAWYEANPDKVKAKTKAYKEANPDKVKATNKAWQEVNSDKVKEYQKTYKEANKEKINALKSTYDKNHPNVVKAAARKYSLKKYNLTPNQYQDIFDSQLGCCAICNKIKTKEDKTMAVDHCHETNKVRGLLCQKCNTGLGLFNDNQELLIKAVAYLDYK